MQQTIKLVAIISLSFMCGYLARWTQEGAHFRLIQQVAHEVYMKRLNDPAYCVSVCQEEFEKYGC